MAANQQVTAPFGGVTARVATVKEGDIPAGNPGDAMRTVSDDFNTAMKAETVSRSQDHGIESVKYDNTHYVLDFHSRLLYYSLYS